MRVAIVIDMRPKAVESVTTPGAGWTSTGKMASRSLQWPLTRKRLARHRVMRVGPQPRSSLRVLSPRNRIERLRTKESLISKLTTRVRFSSPATPKTVVLREISGALAKVSEAESAMSRAIASLVTQDEMLERIAALRGIQASEVRRLRKLGPTPPAQSAPAPRRSVLKPLAWPPGNPQGLALMLAA
jgi:hypothetical protein